MAFKQPRVPEYREREGADRYIRSLVLFLKDFCMDVWTANNQRSGEISDAVKGYPVTSVCGKTGDVKLTAASVGAVPTSRKVNGKTLSGDITLAFSNLQNEFEGDGSTSEGGYLAFAQLKITGGYANRPIEFELISRGRPTSCLVSVQFENVNSTDPGLKKIYYRGSSYGVFIQKTGTGTWVLYYKKDGTYDKLTVKRVSSASQGITITYTGSHVTSKPTSNVTDAVPYELEKTYPVGSIYMSVKSTSPASLFGGTWEEMKGRFLLGRNDSHAAGSTGGEENHKLTVDEIPSHGHNAFVSSGTTGVKFSAYSGKWGGAVGSSSVEGYGAVTLNTGGSKAHNMPPYLAAYMWKRGS